MDLTVDGVSVHVRGRALLADVTVDVPSGSFVAVVGPNGSGKSTLLRTIYRAMRPSGGRVALGDADVWASPAKVSAARRAVVTQHQTGAAGLLVADVVATGRQVHQRWYRPDSAGDRREVDDAMGRCGVAALAGRTFASLSGGERQRVLLARALAQDAPCVLLDEPTNHLDPRARHEVLGLLDGLRLTRVVVLHDLDHAVAHADLLVVLHEGRVHAVGEPTTVLTAGLAAEVFGVRAEVVVHPITGRPHLVTAALTEPAPSPAPSPAP